MTSSTSTSPNPYIICAKLRELDPPEVLLPAQLEGMSWALAQRLVARLMGGRGVYRVGQRVNKRVMDVKQERYDSLSLYERREREKAFRQGLSTEVWKEARKLGFNYPLTRKSLREFKTDLTSQRKCLLSLISFLVTHKPPPNHASRPPRAPSTTKRIPGLTSKSPTKDSRSSSEPALSHLRASSEAEIEGGGEGKARKAGRNSVIRRGRRGMGSLGSRTPSPRPLGERWDRRGTSDRDWERGGTIERGGDGGRYGGRIDDEVERLKMELEKARMSQIQLLKETSGEKWEERRVLLLKAQNFQLEEQVTNLLDSAAQRNDLIRDMSLCARALQLRIKDLKVPGLESAGEALEALEREAQRLEVKAFSAATRRLALPEEFVDPMQARTLTSKLLFSSHKGFPPFLKLDRVNTLEHSLANLIPDLEELYLLVVQHPMFLSSHFSGTTSKKFNLKRISALIKSLKTAISQLGDLSALLPSRSPPPAQVSRSASASKVVAILEDLASSKTTTRLPKDGKEQRNAIGKLARLAKSEEKAAVAREHRGEKETAKYQRYAAALLAGSQSLQTALRKIDEVVLRLGSGDVRKELKELATPLDPKLFEDSGAYEHAEIDRKNRIDHLADTLEGIEPYVQTIFRRFDVVMREHAIEMGRDENEEKVRESR